MVCDSKFDRRAFACGDLFELFPLSLRWHRVGCMRGHDDMVRMRLAPAFLRGTIRTPDSEQWPATKIAVARPRTPNRCPHWPQKLQPEGGEFTAPDRTEPRVAKRGLERRVRHVLRKRAPGFECAATAAQLAFESKRSESCEFFPEPWG